MKIPKPAGSGGAAKIKLTIQLSASNGSSLAGPDVKVVEGPSGVEISSGFAARVIRCCCPAAFPTR